MVPCGTPPIYLDDLAHVDHEQKSTKKELERKAMDLLQTSDVSLILIC